jgi:glycosyltransferase involved in cell wall biosynthesis
MTDKRTIWFISEVYHPDEQGTAFYTTGLAEGLANDFDTRVLCSFPTVTARGKYVLKHEVRNRVQIVRCMGTTFDKDILILRFVNILTCSLAILVKALGKVRKGDIVIGVTAPPSMPFIAKAISLLVGAKCFLRLEDVYPEIMVATGLLKEHTPIVRALGRLNRMLYKNVDRIVVLGRDMEALVARKMGYRRNRLKIIRCWADTDIVRPLPKTGNAMLRHLGLSGKFVVSCIGNMGRAQAIELIFEAAALLKDHPVVRFLFVGTGVKKKWLEKQIESKKLTNISIVGQHPRSEQIHFLNACDISIISLLPGISGAAVPSRVYNIMAAGKPVISLTSSNSEVALIVREEEIGWVVPSADPVDLVKAILDAAADPRRLRTMGLKAHKAAVEKYTREKIIQNYRDLFKEMQAVPVS